MTCPDTFDENPLYAAANLPSERVSVAKKDLQAVIECCVPDDVRSRDAVLAQLDVKGKTVNRLALFDLLKRHAKHHTPTCTPQRILDCNCDDCLKRRGKPAPKPLSGILIGVDKGGKDQTIYAAVEGRKILAVGPDELAVAFKAYLSTEPEKRFKQVCKANGIDPAKYAGRNFGLQRMALGNELRNRLKKGTAVTVGEQVLK